ncbi:hypothetical protein OAY13_00540 [Candidatus Pelagibacter sp.]|nr:hypothetical protein [Candidatus Pelagibacter sp.]
MKKTLLIYFSISLAFFIYGFASHKYQFFPYKNLVQIKKIFKKKNTIVLNEKDYKKIIKYQSKIRNDFPEWKKKIRLIEYFPGLNIFSDRNYFNHKNDNFLKNKYLLQLPRHHKVNIKIEFLKNTKAYKIICKTNENNLDGWNKVQKSLLIISSTCIHDEIYQKSFEIGKYIIQHGGPVSTDPIFFEIVNLNDIKILN